MMFTDVHYIFFASDDVNVTCSMTSGGILSFERVVQEAFFPKSMHKLSQADLIKKLVNIYEVKTYKKTVPFLVPPCTESSPD